MSYQRERDAFIATVTREGLPLWIAERLLREATGFHRRAELACSSEAANRDRVPCPFTLSKRQPCLCDGPDEHEANGRIPRITLQDWHAETRLKKLLAEHNKTLDLSVLSQRVGCDWQLLAHRDPRGYVLRVIPPSYASRNAGKDRHNLESIGVPARESRLRF